MAVLLWPFAERKHGSAGNSELDARSPCVSSALDERLARRTKQFESDRSHCGKQTRAVIGDWHQTSGKTVCCERSRFLRAGLVFFVSPRIARKVRAADASDEVDEALRARSAAVLEEDLRA